MGAKEDEEYISFLTNQSSDIQQQQQPQQIISNEQSLYSNNHINQATTKNTSRNNINKNTNDTPSQYEFTDDSRITSSFILLLSLSITFYVIGTTIELDRDYDRLSDLIPTIWWVLLPFLLLHIINGLYIAFKYPYHSRLITEYSPGGINYRNSKYKNGTNNYNYNNNNNNTNDQNTNNTIMPLNTGITTSSPIVSPFHHNYLIQSLSQFWLFLISSLFQSILLAFCGAMSIGNFLGKTIYTDPLTDASWVLFWGYFILTILYGISLGLTMMSVIDGYRTMCEHKRYFCAKAIECIIVQPDKSGYNDNDDTNDGDFINDNNGYDDNNIYQPPQIN